MSDGKREFQEREQHVEKAASDMKEHREIHPSSCPSIHSSSIHSSIHPSTHPPIYVTTYPFTHPSSHLPTYPPTRHPSVQPLINKLSLSTQHVLRQWSVLGLHQCLPQVFSLSRKAEKWRSRWLYFGESWDCGFKNLFWVGCIFLWILFCLFF
jgi:hypothetical protein